MPQRTTASFAIACIVAFAVFVAFAAALPPGLILYAVSIAGGVGVFTFVFQMFRRVG